MVRICAVGAHDSMIFTYDASRQNFQTNEEVKRSSFNNTAF